MKSWVVTLALAGFFILGACRSDIAAVFPASGAHSFHTLLAHEYRNIAAYEEEEKMRGQEAALFQSKARRALRHQRILPENPADYDVPDDARAALEEAYIILADALDYLKTSENELLLALAQTRFDCWLLTQRHFSDADNYIACRDQFKEAIARLSVSDRDYPTYFVYFEPSSVALEDEDMQTVRRFAEQYKGRVNWSVVVKGYADSTGNSQQNKIISMRRAIAVKNALGQHGIPLDDIAISAVGEAGVDHDTDDRYSRRVEMIARPVYLEDEINLTQVPGWHHSGQNTH